MVPDGWEETRLGKVCKINPRTLVIEKPEAQVPFLRMADVSEQADVINYGSRFYIDVKSGFTRFAKSDVLIAKITPCFENGKGAFVDDLPHSVGFGSTEFHILREMQNQTYAGYIHLVVNSHAFRERGGRNMQGSAGQRRVPTDFIKAYPIILPPLPEQRKIAEILSTWDKAIETTEALLVTAQDQKRALMQALLTSKRRFPEFAGEEWLEVQLGDVCTPKQWPTISQKEMCDTGYPVFGANGFIGYYGQYNHLHPTTVVTCRGATCGTVSRTPAKTYITGNAMSLDDVNTNEVDEDYLFFAVQRRGFNDIISGSAQPQIIGKDIRSVKIDLPSIGEQKKISAVLKVCDLETRKLSNEVEILRVEKKALMQQLLTGKRRVVV